jgi:hypothetical protein
MDIKTIGFFGDSFCALESNEHSTKHGYATYIKKLKNHYDAKIVNLGMGGSSVWDLYFNQLLPLIKSNSVPDICVFVWTHSGKIFHRTSRSLHASAALNGFNKKKFDWFAKTYPSVGYNFFAKEIYEAAKEYYLHLYDQEKEDLEHIAQLQYIDNNVLNLLPESTKIIHLWAFGSSNFSLDNGWHPDNISYPHNWKHGTTILPCLMSLSAADYTWPVYPVADERPNHLEGDKNSLVFDWIKYAIDTEQNKDYTTDVVKRWK